MRKRGNLHLHVEPQQRESYLAGCVSVVEQARGTAGCVDFAITADLIDPAALSAPACVSSMACRRNRGASAGDDRVFWLALELESQRTGRRQICRLRVTATPAFARAAFFTSWRNTSRSRRRVMKECGSIIVSGIRLSEQAGLRGGSHY
jgi:hypothetical protein